MAIENVALVLAAEGLNMAEKCLLMVCANYSDAHGYCWPGVERIAADMGASRSTVKRTRKGLEARNLLRHQRRTTRAGDSDTNVYRLNLAALREMRRPERDYGDNLLGLDFEPSHMTSHPVPDSPADLPIVQSGLTPVQGEPGVGPSWTDGRATVDPKPLVEPSGEPTTDQAEAAADFLEDVNREYRRGRMGRQQMKRLEPRVVAAFEHGWTPKALLDHLTSGNESARSAFGIVSHRLGDLPPATAAKPMVSGKPQFNALPACDECGAKSGDAPGTRMIDTEAGARRCICHPQSQPSLWDADAATPA